MYYNIDSNFSTPQRKFSTRYFSQQGQQTYQRKILPAVNFLYTFSASSYCVMNWKMHLRFCDIRVKQRDEFSMYKHIRELQFYSPLELSFPKTQRSSSIHTYIYNVFAYFIHNYNLPRFPDQPNFQRLHEFQHRTL